MGENGSFKKSARKWKCTFKTHVHLKHQVNNSNPQLSLQVKASLLCHIFIIKSNSYKINDWITELNCFPSHLPHCPMCSSSYQHSKCQIRCLFSQYIHPKERKKKDNIRLLSLAQTHFSNIWRSGLIGDETGPCWIAIRKTNSVLSLNVFWN